MAVQKRFGSGSESYQRFFTRPSAARPGEKSNRETGQSPQRSGPLSIIGYAPAPAFCAC